MTHTKKLDNELREFVKLLDHKWEHTKVKFYYDNEYLGYNMFSNDITTISNIIKQADEAYGKNHWNEFTIHYRKEEEAA